MLLNRDPAAGTLASWVPPADGDYLTVAHTSRDLLAMPDGRLFFAPLALPQGVSVDRLAVQLTTAAASSVVRLGIYADDETTPGTPGQLIAATAEVDTSDAGDEDSLLGADLDDVYALGPGRWWLAAVAQGGTPTVRSYNGAPVALPWPSYSAVDLLGRSDQSVSAALPATGDPDNAHGELPLVFARSAS